MTSNSSADLSIRILSGIKEQDMARAIFNEVWPSDEGTQITANLLQAMVHNGTYVAGAFVGNEIVAAAFAFPGLDSKKHLHLHSHMAAVKEKYRNRNIGTALKLHQKEWALQRGYDTITWTFDPLVRRNAKLNLVKLGVQVFDYFSDFYGDLPDALNAGDPTDRLIARWDIANQNPATKEMDGRGISVALEDHNGEPIQHEVNPRSSQVLLYLPADIIDLRAKDRALALRWRLAMRNQLQPRLDAGWHISGFTSDGAYIVTQSPLAEVLK
ncbi:MAG TPA: GNAT family N-acetyltransferase [Candidatus Nanopelagicaceae bacterium]